MNYLSTIIGTYRLLILQGYYQNHILGSPFTIRVTSADTDFDRTLVNRIPDLESSPFAMCFANSDCAALPEVIAGTPAVADYAAGGSFRITANDRFGNKKDGSLLGAPYRATLSTMYFDRVLDNIVPHTVEAVIESSTDGSFTARFASTKAGEYIISVAYGLGFPVLVQVCARNTKEMACRQVRQGLHRLFGVALTFGLVQTNTHVRPAELDVGKSYPYGAGLRGGLLQQNVSFFIQQVDIWGNIIERKGADTFKVRVASRDHNTLRNQRDGM